MLTVNRVSHRFGDLLLFDNVTFTVNAGDRIGLVGPNGTGKTTLLRLITGDLPPNDGSVSLAPGVRLGYLRQGFSDIPTGTLRDVLDIPTNGLLRAHDELSRATDALADPSVDPDAAAHAFEHATDAFEASGGYHLLGELDAFLDRFGLGGSELDRPLASMSGGQKTRAGLAALLATHPDVLVLDEPTNHLDEHGLTWLTGFLADYAGAVIVVSHDRAFLDDVVREILYLDRDTRTVTPYAGNYSAFVAARTREEDEAAAAWRRQQVEVERINRDIRVAESNARSIEASTVNFAVRKKAAKIARPAVVRKRKLERQLASEDAAEKPERHWSMSVDFPLLEGGARQVVVLDDVSVRYGETIVLNGVSDVIRHGERIALLGDNGSGKTTLIRLLTGELTPTSGSVRLGRGVKIGYFAQEQQTLDPERSVLDHARQIGGHSDSDIRTELHKFLFGGDTVHRLVADLSYGERARLMLALMVMNETNLLLLDEPLNHLDLESREEFEQALQNFSGTMVMVLHDRYAVERLATRAIEIVDGAFAVAKIS